MACHLLFAITVLCVAPALAIDWKAVDRLRANGQLEQALQVIHSAGPARLPASTALKAAATEQQLLDELGRHPEAQAAGRRWATLAARLGDRRQQAMAEHAIGRSFLGQQRNQQAGEHFLRALDLARAPADEDLQLPVLIDLAQAQTSMSQYASSDKLLDQAERLWKKKRDPVASIRIKLQRAGTMHRRGATFEVLPLLEEALAASIAAGNQRLLRTTLIRLGQVHGSLHQYPEALSCYRRALAEKPDRQQRLVTLISTGICEFELNRFDEAFRTFEDARKEAVELGSPNLEAWALGELGLTVWKLQQNEEQAIGYFDRAIQGFTESKDPRNALTFLENKGNIYRFQRRFQDALRVYRQVEQGVRRIPGQEPTPNLYKAMGQCLAGLGRHQEGEKLLRLAVEKAQAAGDSKRVWQGYQELARLYRGRNQVAPAAESYRRALDSIESMRGMLRLDAFKADFFEDKVGVYEEYANLLLSGAGESRVAQAFAVAERARARSFLDSLAESRAALDETLPAETVRAEAAILAEISAVQGRIRKGENSTDLGGRLAEKEKQLEALHLRVRTSHPRFQQMRYPRPVDEAALRKSLRPGEVVLEYFIGDQASYAWIASPGALTFFALPPRAELDRAVRSSYAPLLRPRDPVPAMEDLARLLLGPLESADGSRSLIIIPSGILYYFPFEVLPLGPHRKPLVDHYRVSYSPSASTLVEARARTRHATVARLLAVGDTLPAGRRPVPQSERSAALLDVSRLAPLPHTRKEVTALASLFGRGNSTVLLGRDAAEHNLKQQDLARYSVIHIAAHGFLDSSSSSRSGLVLGMDPAVGDDGILQVREVYRLPLRAGLVTLSACQSALGRLLTGEGMVGLSRAFFYAGADSILASLWNVNDDAAAEFMARFYRLLKDGASKEEALRKAKLSMASEARYRHPYYWAPYILIGDGASGVAFPKRRLVLLAGAAALAALAATIFTWFILFKRRPA